MTRVLKMLRQGSHAAFPARERQLRQQFCSSSRMRMAAVLSYVVFVALLCHAPLFTAEAAQKVFAECKPGANEITCTCSEASDQQVEETMSATLSQKQNVMKLVCKPDMACAPEGLSKKVCKATDSTLDQGTCDEELSRLLAGSQRDVSWEEVKEKIQLQGESKSLTVPPQNFPFVDEQFAVGCKASDNEKKCTFTVTLAARPTATDGQTVTCAYGASSNQSHQKIKLNPTQNSFTLVCGEKGEVLPTRYEEGFCSSGLKGDEESCEGSYTSVLPGYEAKWWSKHDADNSYTLSIPNDKFPAEEAKLIVGCRQKPSSDPAKGATAAAVSSTVCNVDVTIEASSSASLSSRREDVFGLLAGAAVMTVFARHA
ncbi:SAG-related sequence [Besnoitia besnoiti]|uniref:SAG-related sequence n=1 Tax=Besnoitia besnoiti TaxID=94643 RepID=A0A2A9MDK7_BESBE|nr:SAG-related sequence [Besnoitia besnoiti]PFH36075.1 SAG-related sequence [Besnoitia besnoiti]